MPKYTFTCPVCHKAKQQLTSVKTEEIPCECGNSMKREFPNLANQQLFETVNTYTNVQWTPDQKEQTQDRRDTHYWEVEVPRLIEKYSLETCLEQGWLKYNDKQELVINKPPKKR